MKKLSAIAGIIVSVFLGNAASARDTDLGPSLRNSWDGFYFGLNAGYARATARWTDVTGVTTDDFTGKGMTIGVTAGRNWQMHRWVYGLEGDLSLSTAKATTAPFVGCAPFCQTELSSLATFRGRVGYLANPDVLIFATGGLAAGTITHTDIIFPFSRNRTVGWTAGVGIEGKIAPQWTLKAEYLFVNLGGGQVCDAATCVFAIENDKLDMHLFRFGLNRHFSTGASASDSDRVSARSFAQEANVGPGPQNTWDSFYFGLNAGYARATARWTDAFGFSTGDFSASGTTIGATAGKNWQMGRWVYGVEGDVSLSILNASTFTFLCFPVNCQTEMTMLATFRGRYGYLFNPDTLLFATGGLAAGTLTHGNAIFTSARGTELGWTIGAGLESKITPQWSVKAEYLFVSLGGGLACDAGICLVNIENDTFDVHLFRFGLNRHF
jgi:outer membrane immunogenic protein